MHGKLFYVVYKYVHILIGFYDYVLRGPTENQRDIFSAGVVVGSDVGDGDVFSGYEVYVAWLCFGFIRDILETISTSNYINLFHLVNTISS